MVEKHETIFAHLFNNNEDDDDNDGKSPVDDPASVRGVMLPVDPLEHFGEYRCSECACAVSGLTLFALAKGLEDETRLSQLLRALHPNHYLVLRVKKALLDIMSQNPEPK